MYNRLANAKVKLSFLNLRILLLSLDSIRINIWKIIWALGGARPTASVANTAFFQMSNMHSKCPLQAGGVGRNFFGAIR